MDIRTTLGSSKYLKAADLQNRSVEVTMQSVEMENVATANQDPEHKPALYFLGREKALILNQVNSNMLLDAYGPETDDWNGKKIVLYPTKTDFGGKLVDCIRVRLPEQQVGGDDNVPF